jgi:phospholipid/cholesterol/gamma-HCH transport system substrate-binding protein
VKISRNTKIGFVFLTSIVILIVGINYLKGINFFKPQKSYYVVYTKIDGLVTSSPITINGFQVGTVKKIYLDPTNNQDIVANFNITNEKVKIPINSVAKIYSSDLMGTKAIEIIFADTNIFHSIGDTKGYSGKSREFFYNFRYYFTNRKR